MLQSPRPKLPAASEKQAEPTTPNGLRVAELWDDPFAVFKRNDSLPVITLGSEHKARALLLVVLTNIGKYELDSEERLRRRFAVESAIRDSEFTSETPGELTETTLHLDSRAGGSKGLIFLQPTL